MQGYWGDGEMGKDRREEETKQRREEKGNRWPAGAVRDPLGERLRIAFLVPACPVCEIRKLGS
jgi:hypothetical protein